MADEDRQGGMRGNVGRLIDHSSPQTEEDLLRDAIIADQLRNVYKGGGGSPLSSLLSQGQKVPAEMYGPNWPKGRHNPFTWLSEKIRGANVPGSRSGQWVYSKPDVTDGFRRQAGSFADPATWIKRNLRGLSSRSWQDFQAMDGQRGPIPREFKSGRQIGRDVHSIVSARLNQVLGEPRAGEAWNSSARMSAAKKLGLLKGLPIAGAVGSAAYDTYKVATEPDYSMGEYGLDLAENASWLGGWGTGILGSSTRLIGEEVANALKKGTSAFRNMSGMEKLKWILAQRYP